MPLLDAYIPSGALSPDAEQELIASLTDLLLEHEGVDPANDTGRHIAWLFVHRPEVYVAGSRPNSPRYRFICQVPEGQYNDERRASNGLWLARAGRYGDARIRAGILHKATCDTITPTPDREWTKDYIKVCSTDRSELDAWARSHGRRLTSCVACDP